VPSVARPRRPAAVTFVVWTFLVWTTRIGNIWRDEALDTGEQVSRTLLALSFTVLALAVVATLARRTSPRATRIAVDALAGWTVAVWAVRATGILLADHDLAFTLVHLVLAVGSTLLAVWAAREARRAEAAAGPGAGEATPAGTSSRA
jgi:hypothetical protein